MCVGGEGTGELNVLIMGRVTINHTYNKSAHRACVLPGNRVKFISSNYFNTLMIFLTGLKFSYLENSRKVLKSLKI